MSRIRPSSCTPRMPAASPTTPKVTSPGWPHSAGGRASRTWSATRGNQCVQLPQWHGSTEVKALSQARTDVPEQLPLRLVLDPLGDDLQTERMAQVDDRPQD